jgi:hypothetical protein
MEPEGIFSCSQDPATGPYHEPDASSPHLPTLSLRDPFWLGLQSDLFPSGLINQNFVSIFYLAHLCYMPRSSHQPWFHDPNSVWWRVQVINLFIMQFSAASHHFLSLRSKYCPGILFSNTLNLCSSRSVRTKSVVVSNAQFVRVFTVFRYTISHTACYKFTHYLNQATAMFLFYIPHKKLALTEIT